MNEKRKKIMKIIIAMVALAMIVSTFAGIFGNRSAKTENETKVTKDSISTKDKKAINDTLNKDIPEDVKKDMQNAKVQVKDNTVSAVIVATKELNQIQLDNVAEQYARTLESKYKGKEVNVKVMYKNQVASDFNGTTINLGKGIPSAKVEIAPGLVMSSRYVRVILNTPNPEKYSVEVLGKKLEYKKEKKFFHNIVDSYDENAIKKGVKITPQK
ncbi:hypothetical protein Z965_02765 [Clostridium novyi A str. BKT29909]|uniref:hypothetical protein n=1 Tax=Clostridium TaxID=1485 RepID=UPI0004D6FEC6|nr:MULTISPECIES: hypothetical protein [Clostridium]KEH89472.1 hypothetical protein Z965_02765 [Clostridium novyi A str. BKT29909]KEH93085.1 hypothetical protein Z963_03075 [Clostridium botulinum C/D str. It1]